MPILLFFLLINVEMLAIVGILTFMSRKNFMNSDHTAQMFRLIWIFTVHIRPVLQIGIGKRDK